MKFCGIVCYTITSNFWCGLSVDILTGLGGLPTIIIINNVHNHGIIFSELYGMVLHGLLSKTVRFSAFSFIVASYW